MEREGNTVTRDVMFGTDRSIISFQVGPDNGEDLGQQLSKYEDQGDLDRFDFAAEVPRLCPPADQRHAKLSFHNEDSAVPALRLRPQHPNPQRFANMSTGSDPGKRPSPK